MHFIPCHWLKKLLVILTCFGAIICSVSNVMHWTVMHRANVVKIGDMLKFTCENVCKASRQGDPCKCRAIPYDHNTFTSIFCNVPVAQSTIFWVTFGCSLHLFVPFSVVRHCGIFKPSAINGWSRTLEIRRVVNVPHLYKTYVEHMLTYLNKTWSIRISATSYKQQWVFTKTFQSL